MSKIIYLMKRVHILALAIATVSPLSYGAESDEPFLLDPAVQERAAISLKGYRPQSKTLKLAELHEINNVGNFGKLVYYERLTYYSRQESGLWEIVASGRFTSGAAAGVSQSLSLCGLITLLTATSSTTQLDTTTAIPFGRMFVPFGIRSSIDVGRRARVKEFRTDYEEICSPVPGSRFTYQIENEVQIKTSGLFGRTVVATAVVDVSCQVAKDLIQAKELLLALRGDYLAVSCESTAKSGQRGKVIYAFLNDPGIYLILSDSGSAQTTKMQYKAVDYEE